MGVFGKLGLHFLLIWLVVGRVSPAIAELRPQLDLYCPGMHEGKVFDKSVTRKYDQGVGFNPSQYLTQRYVSSPWLLSGSADRPEDLTKEREKFKVDKLKEFIKERGAAVFDVAAVLDQAERSGLSTLSAAVRISEERAEVDCRTGHYVYSVEFLIPRNPLQLLSYPLRIALEDAVEKAVGQPFSGPVLKDVLTFRVGEIVEQLRKTLAANERVVRESGKPESALRFLHPRFRALFLQESPTGQSIQRAQWFGVGEYRLSPEMAYVIEQILRRFLRRPETEKSRFDLVVRGYADARAVRKIMYDGACDIDARENSLNELSTANRATQATSTTITSNSQLSVARACEGALFAKGLIPASRPVRVFYSGGGAIAGAPQDVNRGIELRLQRSL